MFKLTRKKMSNIERQRRSLEKLGFSSIFFLLNTKIQRMFPGGIYYIFVPGPVCFPANNGCCGLGWLVGFRGGG